MLLPVLSSAISRLRRTCAVMLCGTMFALALLSITQLAISPALAQTPTEQAVNNVAGVTDTKVTVTVNGTRAMCDEGHEKAYQQGRSVGMWDRLAKDEQAMRYNVAAAYASNCIDDLLKTLERIDRVVSTINATAGSTSVVGAAITLAAIRILETVVDAVLAAINNQVCNIANELTATANSVLRNAVCLPTLGGGLGSLGFNVDLNLGRQKCNGWSVNLLGLGSINPDGSYSGSAEELIRGQPITGIGGFSYASALPPEFRNDLPSDDSGFFDYVEGGENMPVTVVSPGGAAYNGPDCGRGDYKDFTDALAGTECNTGYSCINREFGYLGRYQMGCLALKQTGYVSSCPNGQKSYQTYVWTGKDGVRSAEDFLNSKTAQENAIRSFETAVFAGLRSSLGGASGLASLMGKTITYQNYQRVNGQCVPTTTSSVVLTQSGLAAAAHLLGPGGAANCVKQSLNGGVCSGKDGNCVSPGKYMTIDAGFDLSEFAGFSCRVQ